MPALRSIFAHRAPEEVVMNDISAAPHTIEKSTTEARQGVTPGVVRWVLALSLLAAIAAMVITYWIMRGF
jgi:hypothetical protein